MDAVRERLHVLADHRVHATISTIDTNTYVKQVRKTAFEECDIRPRGRSRATANSKATNSSITAIGSFICQSNSKISTQNTLQEIIVSTIIGSKTFQL